MGRYHGSCPSCGSKDEVVGVEESAVARSERRECEEGHVYQVSWRSPTIEVFEGGELPKVRDEDEEALSGLLEGWATMQRSGIVVVENMDRDELAAAIEAVERTDAKNCSAAMFRVAQEFEVKLLIRARARGVDVDAIRERVHGA